MANYTIRRATPADALACGKSCYAAFRKINADHNFPPELPMEEVGIGILSHLFNAPGFQGFVAESDGVILGSNVVDLRSPIAGIGPITIDPAIQNKGLGRALMQAVLDEARANNAVGIRLIQAAFHNRSLSLYAKLGFDAREPLSVMNGDIPRAVPDGCSVRAATADDQPACNELCEKVHGFARWKELVEGVEHGTALVVERHGRITGYASAFGYFGHSVGETNAEIISLIASAKDIGGPGILIPTRNAELFRWALNNGLRVLFPMTLMSIGLYNEPKGSYLPSVLF
ncbi:MAG: GNAT family N-acetyltransferase [Acidobacteria bacterium]|nr:GNAT family N-acetyltransferase [Acidobacteriota bacterium]